MNEKMYGVSVQGVRRKVIQQCVQVQMVKRNAGEAKSWGEIQSGHTNVQCVQETGSIRRNKVDLQCVQEAKEASQERYLVGESGLTQVTSTGPSIAPRVGKEPGLYKGTSVQGTSLQATRPPIKNIAKKCR